MSQTRLNYNIPYSSGERIKTSQVAESGSQNYDDLTKAELIKLIKNKDKFIEEMKETLKDNCKAEKEKVSMYRLKLEEQIAHNQKVVKSFEIITQTVVEIIKKYEFLDYATRETVANAVEAIRESCGKHNRDVENQDEQEMPDDSFSCIDQIVEETAKLLEYLSQLTDENVRIVVRLRQELARSKGKSSQLLGGSEEARLLKAEINQLMIENKNLTRLLQRNETEKNLLRMSISTALTQKMMDQLHKLTTVELIEQIKKMSLRAKELELDKEQIYKKSRVEKELNQKKYIDLLKEVKQIKLRRKLGLEIQ